MNERMIILYKLSAIQRFPPKKKKKRKTEQKTVTTMEKFELFSILIIVGSV